MRTTALVLALAVLSGCASQTSIRRLQAYRAAKDRGDEAAAAAYVAPGAQMWFQEKKGPGEAFGNGSGSWAHWDEYFHSHTTFTDWSANGKTVSALAHETNDLYRLLDWTPRPYRMNWTLDDSGRISEVLLVSIPGKDVTRMSEFKAWAAEHHPDFLPALMPKGQFDPSGDHAERWKAILTEWRAAVGLPAM